MNRKSAFTLIELLVVIAIIAILAAILFPVFAQAKAAAKKASALSNIKQNATAVQLYLSDADDTYPQSAYAIGAAVVIPGSGAQIYSVYDALMPYTKNRDIFTDTAEPQAINWPNVLAGIGLLPFLNGGTTIATATNVIQFAGFAPNFAVFEDPAVPPTLAADAVRSATSFPFPADTILFASAKYGRAGVINPDLDATTAIGQSNTAGVQAAIVTKYRQPAGPFAAENFPGVARHSETLVINFADGHAKAFRRNFRFAQNTWAPDTLLTGAANIVPTYNLPFDINGIPEIVAEPAP